MAGTAVRETVTLAGRAERERAARCFVSEVLGPGHPFRDDAVLLVSEIFGNSVRHCGAVEKRVGLAHATSSSWGET